MKATQKDFAAVAPRAVRACKTFFFCGPDEAGAAAAAQRIAAMLEEPGEQVEIAGADLRRDPVLLADEARSTSLFAGARHIVVRAAGDEAHDALANHLAAIDAGEGAACPVLVVATAATDKSRTAKLLDGRADALVAMFYPPDLRTLTASVRDLADAAGVRRDQHRNAVAEDLRREAGFSAGEIDAVIRNRMELENEADTARAQAVVKATISATEAGVPLGSVVQEMNQKAIALAHQVWDDQQLRMTPQRLRLLRKLAQKPLEPKTETSSDTVDIDPVKTWSVSRLLHWIEGPISDASPAPLNRKQIVVRENAERQAARARRKAPPKDSRDDENLTEADVDLAVQNALSATAEFFLLDIEDMLFRAKELSVRSATVSACGDLMPLLRDLMNAPSGDDQKARALLHQAETAIQHLRQDVKATEADARTRQKFGECLQNALASEALVEGKRHGGTIACPLHPSDWAWVAEQYHLRGLPWVTRIEVDGVMQPLRPDQAVGLYVTGKSLSGYLFDVSVHLWQRKPGRNSAASVSLTPFSPINAEDWIDTLTPCAVLHVPSAH